MIFAAVAVAFLAALLVSPARQRLFPSILRRRHHSQVVVTMRDAQTFRGVLAGADSEVVVLRNAEALTSATATGVFLDGEVILPRSQIAYLQRP